MITLIQPAMYLTSRFFKQRRIVHSVKTQHDAPCGRIALRVAGIALQLHPDLLCLTRSVNRQPLHAEPVTARKRRHVGPEQEVGVTLRAAWIVPRRRVGEVDVCEAKHAKENRVQRRERRV